MKLLSTLAPIIVFVFFSTPGLAQDSGPVTMQVPGPKANGANIDPRSYEGSVSSRSWSGLFSGRFNSALVGYYLDPQPAQRRADELRSIGVATFVLSKMVNESQVLGSDPVGVFYVVMAGLFGRKADADTLGQRLRAEGLISDFRTLPVDDPGEIQSVAKQNQALYAHGQKVSRDSREKAARPLAPGSPSQTGEAFKKHVYGRYVGSYRDPVEAREAARKMTVSGWSASVERDGQWNRVYLAPTDDHRNFRAEESVLKSAQRSASQQPGFFIIADISSLKGAFNPETPSKSKDDASGCAGLSEAGRLGAVLNRTIIYVPDSSFTAALIPVLPQSIKWDDIKNRAKDRWNNRNSTTPLSAVYGPAIYRRPEMEAAIAKLRPTPKAASLARQLGESAEELNSVPGPKIVVIFSEFMGPDKPEELMRALGQLKSRFGSSLKASFVYGDTNAQGYYLAQRLAREAGAQQAWDGCRLLADNAYFERYIKNVFR